MRHTIQFLLALFFAISAAAIAQPQQPRHERNREEVNQQLFEAKCTEMCCRLKLTDDQKAKFVPLYKEYDTKIRQVWHKYRVAKKDATSAEKEKMHIKRQQKVQEVRLKYIDDFSKILTEEQFSQFLRIEKEMQNRVMLRKNARGGKRPRPAHDKNARQPANP